MKKVGRYQNSFEAVLLILALDRRLCWGLERVFQPFYVRVNHPQRGFEQIANLMYVLNVDFWKKLCCFAIKALEQKGLFLISLQTFCEVFGNSVGTRSSTKDRCWRDFQSKFKSLESVLQLMFKVLGGPTFSSESLPRHLNIWIYMCSDLSELKTSVLLIPNHSFVWPLSRI